MGLLAILGMGKQAGDAIASPIDAISNGLDKLFTSDEERATANQVMEKIRQQPSIMQVELNKVEAQHRSMFVAGWRPAIGWVLAISLAFFYIPQFALASVLWVKVCWAAEKLQPYPISEIGGLTQLVFALLGLGTLRTAEKFGGKTK